MKVCCFFIFILIFDLFAGEVVLTSENVGDIYNVRFDEIDLTGFVDEYVLFADYFPIALKGVNDLFSNLIFIKKSIKLIDYIIGILCSKFNKSLKDVLSSLDYTIVNRWVANFEEKGRKKNFINNKDILPFMDYYLLSAPKRKYQLIKRLIDEEIIFYPDMIDDNGKKPMDYVKNFDDQEIKFKLLSLGADSGILYKKLFQYVKNNNIGKIEKIFQDAGMDNNSKIINFDYKLKYENEILNLLHFAIKHKKDDIVKLFLVYNADVNSVVGGTTPLLRAVAQSNETIVKLLLDAGADPNIQLAKDIATQAGHDDIVQLLDDYVMGNTPLMIAAREGNLADVNASLIGANLNQRNSDLWTALMFAAESEHQNRVAIIKALLNAGADYSAQNRNNQTALDIARIIDHNDVVHAIRLYTEKGYWLKAKLLEKWKLIALFSLPALGAFGYTIYRRYLSQFPFADILPEVQTD